MSNIKDILNSAISILKTIRINYNSPMGPRTTALVAEVSHLIPLLENDQPIETSEGRRKRQKREAELLQLSLF